MAFYLARPNPSILKYMDLINYLLFRINDIVLFIQIIKDVVICGLSNHNVSNIKRSPF